MVVFVDAYNVLKTMQSVDYVMPRTSEAFIRCAQRRAALRNYYAIVVFDAGEGARPTTYHQSHLEVVYSGLQQSADDMLIELIERSQAHEKVLVTADRSLRKRGIACGAQPVDPITYWRAIHAQEMGSHSSGAPASQKGLLLDASIEYSVDELKKIVFSHGAIPLKDDAATQRRDSVSSKKSKVLKKFEKIKDKL